MSEDVLIHVKPAIAASALITVRSTRIQQLVEEGNRSAVLLERMKFPQYAPDGQPLSYKFHHRASGKQLLDTQTLADVGAKSGDVLRLQPEITAGVCWLLVIGRGL